MRPFSPLTEGYKMAKQIATLVQDMESVIFGQKGWDNTIGQWLELT